MEFLGVLHDLLIAGASLSQRTVSYILRHIDELGKGIGNFPVMHPIFFYIAKSPDITEDVAQELIRLSQQEKSVLHALAHNEALPQDWRVATALSAQISVLP